MNCIVSLVRWVPVAAACVALSSCDWKTVASDWSAELPDGFEATPSRYRVASRNSKSKPDDPPLFKFDRIPDGSDPLLGAALRLRGDIAASNADYQKFLVPKLILASNNKYTGAVSVQFGSAAKEVRAVLPKGDFYLGITPEFSAEWLRDLKNEGAEPLSVAAQLAWSRIRTEDLRATCTVAVVSPFSIPRKYLNPLLVSTLEPSSKKLPEPPAFLKGGAMAWLEGVFYEANIPDKMEPELKSQKKGKWLVLVPPDNISTAKQVTPYDVGIFFGSVALRDNIPCWLTFVGDEFFLVFGALPPHEDCFVFSPSEFLKSQKAKEYFVFLEKSRSLYVEAAARADKTTFLNVEDRRLFFDLPEKQKELPPKKQTSPLDPDQEPEDDNPFSSLPSG